MIYGPNTAAVQSIIDRIPTLSDDEMTRLRIRTCRDDARKAAWRSAYYAACYAVADAAKSLAVQAAVDAARDAERDAARGAARGALWDAERDAARDAWRDAAWYKASGTAFRGFLGVVTYDLATENGPYTTAQRDLLLAPWVEVYGMPGGLDPCAALDGEGMTTQGEPMIYGPNTAAVQSIIDRIPTFTDDEITRLCAARDAAWGALWDAGYAAVHAAEDAARNAARNAPWVAAEDAALGTGWTGPHGAWRDITDAGWYVARDPIYASITYDLATEDGLYTIAQRDLLLAPWVEVCGMPGGLDPSAALDGEG